MPHRAHVPRRPAAARAALHPRRRRATRKRRARRARASCSAPTSRASSRRWTGCPSPSGCSTRRCTSSSPTSRSCSCSDAQGRARRRGPRAARTPRSTGGRRTRCSAPAACRLGILKPGLYRMQVRGDHRGRGRAQAGRRRPAGRDHDPAHRHRARARAARRLGARGRRPRRSSAAGDGEVDYLVGTMIETPRAALVADEIAEVAEFFSFGTNDLTQMTFGFSRDDVEGRFMPEYLEHKLLAANPFETLDREGVGQLVRMARRARPRDPSRPQARHLRRARRRPGVGAVLPRGRPRLRVVLAVPGADRPPRRRARRARRAAGRAPPPDASRGASVTRVRCRSTHERRTESRRAVRGADVSCHTASVRSWRSVASPG